MSVQTKHKTNGEVNPFKARLVAKCYKQKPSIDYFKVFALVARLILFVWLSLLLHKTIEKNFKWIN